jgi:hypothetical protein
VFKKIILNFIARLSPSEKCPYVVILNYHSICLNNSNYIDDWSVSLDMFDMQMKYLADNNVEVIPLNDIENICLNSDLGDKLYVCITFDDGLEDNYINAFPILEKYGINNASFFIVANSLINSCGTSWWLSNDKEAKLMNADQIKNLYNSGHNIGSHALSHQNLNNVSDSVFERELIMSKNILDITCSMDCKSIAIPFGISGNINKEEFAKDICKKNGYNFLFLGRFGYVNSKNYDNVDLPRVPVYGSDSINTFIFKVNGKYNLISKVYFFRKKIRYIFGL